jgi:hypothetical protein
MAQALVAKGKTWNLDSEQRTRVNALLRQRRVGRDDASDLAGGAHGGDAALDDFLHLGLAAVAHAGREVGRAEEHAVHAFGLGNRLEVVHCGHQKARPGTLMQNLDALWNLDALK